MRFGSQHPSRYLQQFSDEAKPVNIQAASARMFSHRDYRNGFEFYGYEMSGSNLLRLGAEYTKSCKGQFNMILW